MLIGSLQSIDVGAPRRKRRCRARPVEALTLFQAGLERPIYRRWKRAGPPNYTRTNPGPLPSGSRISRRWAGVLDHHRHH